MSPLIDCVFLLLIFFLVTTVIKRKEKQIRVKMPDTTASVSENTAVETHVIGMDKKGTALAITGRTKDGGLKWGVIPNLTTYLNELVQKKGLSVMNKPLRIDADGDAHFQKAIDLLDICTFRGFTTVSIKTKQRAD